MMTLITALLASSMLALGLSSSTTEPGDDPRYVLGFEMDRLDGTPESLETYEGRVVLMVNTASRCGFTPQYEGLQALYEEFEDEGLVILGFPANNFMGQEPGTDEDIAEFCRVNYGVTFPMFSKISVRGDDAHPLFKRLAAIGKPQGGEPRWNFTKYLVGRDGRAEAMFPSSVAPGSDELRGRIVALLRETP